MTNVDIERKRVYSYTIRPSVADKLLAYVSKANENGQSTSQSQVVEDLLIKFLRTQK